MYPFNRPNLLQAGDLELRSDDPRTKVKTPFKTSGVHRKSSKGERTVESGVANGGASGVARP